jgi:hypothetical protein
MEKTMSTLTNFKSALKQAIDAGGRTSAHACLPPNNALDAAHSALRHAISEVEFPGSRPGAEAAIASVENLSRQALENAERRDWMAVRYAAKAAALAIQLR